MNDQPGRRLHTSHAVEFFADSERLITNVAAFLAEGLRQGQPAIVISNEFQRAAIQMKLTAAGIDVDRARHAGDLTLADHREMLALVSPEGVLDQDGFNAQAGRLLEQTVRGRPSVTVRIYSDVVDALWQQGRSEAALQLEMLWNELAEVHAFSLLCAYAIGHFYKQTELFDAIQRQHSEVAASAGRVDMALPQLPRSRRVTQREAEVLRRMALGHSNKDIAAALNISVKTVEAHKAHAMRKLGLVERADVVRFAVIHGWLHGGE
jgi:DNA-binding NarL/FixJ family response regulator